MVKINGKTEDIAGKSVLEYIFFSNYDVKCIAVERNGEIVFKNQYENTILQNGDVIEIVRFVGGG